MTTKQQARLAVYNKYNGKCAYCGCDIDLPDMQVDHLESKVSGYDRNDPKNHMPSCPICNQWKHCDNLESFRRSIQQQVRKCRDYSRNFRMAEKYGMVSIKEKEIVFYFETC